MPRLSRFRRRSKTQPAEETAPPAGPIRRAAPPPGELRRERRLLLRAREDRLRDIGGLVLEMYRRDDFRDSLLADVASEVVELEGRLHEIDLLLEARRPPVARCACGAPLFSRSRFCPSCGRPVPAAPVPACGACGHALAADARFCPACGTATTGDAAAASAS